GRGRLAGAAARVPPTRGGQSRRRRVCCDGRQRESPEGIRMPVLPSVAERLMMLALHRGPGPGPMLDFLAAQAFRAVSTGVRLGVFEVLAAGPLSAGQIADRVGADPRGTELLLEALEALGYVRRRHRVYANTAMATRWLLRDSPTSLA